MTFTYSMFDKTAYILVRIRAGTLHDVHHSKYESYFHAFLDITLSWLSTSLSDDDDDVNGDTDNDDDYQDYFCTILEQGRMK